MMEAPRWTMRMLSVFPYSFFFIELLLCPHIVTAVETQYLLVGVSGGLQDGFPERNKMDYENETKAIFIGKALIRGYKAYLDVMEVGYRQYVAEPGQPYINSNVFASGCYEHANEYWFYMIDARQVLFVLNNEPRFLSITPDTGLIDLHMMQNATLQLPDFLKLEYASANGFMEQYLDRLRATQGDVVLDDRYVAVPLVTAVYFNPSSHVLSPIIRTLSDGTEITNFPNSLALWAQVNNSDRTALFDTGCIPPTGACTQSVHETATEAEARFWSGIRKAIRQAEADRPTDTSSSPTIGVGLPRWHCQSYTRFGAGQKTVRVNTPFTLSQIESLLSSMDYVIDWHTNRVVPVTMDDAVDVHGEL